MNETDASPITRGKDSEPEDANSLIEPFKSYNFLFFHVNLRQNAGITMFKLDKLGELTHEKAVLKGDIIFNNTPANGSIIVNLEDRKSVFYHSSSKKKYSLEIDPQFKDIWQNLISKLQEATKSIH